MTDKDTNSISGKLGYDWHRLGYAAVAGEYLKQLGEKGVPYATKALEIILKDCDIADPWVVKTLKDPKVVAKTIQSQLETHAQCMGEQTIGDLIKYHNLVNYLDDSANAENELAPITNENYLDVMKEIAKAEHIVNGKEHGLSTDGEVASAEATIKKYEKANSTISMLEQERVSRFKTRVEGSMTRDALNQLYTPKSGATDGSEEKAAA